MEKVIAIVGPTAAGKTALAVFLAQLFTGELVSVDSRQIYRGLDIGSAKEKDLPVEQHLIDLLSPGEPVTVAQYQHWAYQAIDLVLARGHLPILVGGSMQYISAITEGYAFGGRGSREKKARYDVLLLLLQPEREVLRSRIEKRTKQWVKQGLIEEVENLLKAGVSEDWLDSLGLEYRAFLNYVKKRCSLAEAIENSTVWQAQYVKRQITWWRHHGEPVLVKSNNLAVKTVSKFLTEAK